mgnify:FL=1
MKNVLKNIIENKWTHYIIIAIIGLLISIPMLNMQIIETHDGSIHLLRIIGLNNSMKNSEFPFLIAPYYCRDFGYSMSAIYPQLVTYIPFLFAMLTQSFNLGLKIFAMLTIPISGICMYNFTRDTTKRKDISFLSAIIYMTFPYRFEDIFTRYAIGEFTAFIFLPIVFHGLYNLINGDRKKHFYIAIGAIGLILSHTITTIYAAIFCVIYIIYNFKKFWDKDVIKKCIVNVIFIFLVSSLFIVPLFEYKTQAQYSVFEPGVMKTAGEYVQNNTIEIWQLIKDKGEERGVSFVVGIPTIIMLMLTILVWKNIDKKYENFYGICLVFAVISIYMCTKFFPWRIMPQLICNIQYPWRMIGFAMLFLTPVFAINVCTLLDTIKNFKIKSSLYVLSAIVLIIFAVIKITNYQYLNNENDKNYENRIQNNPIISHFAINRDYMPYKAIIKQRSYVQTREDRIYVIKGNEIIENEEKDGLKMFADIKNAIKGDVLEFPYFFYPGYEVTIETSEKCIKLKIEESENGFVQITIPENIESGKINFCYKGTNIEKVSYIISAISLIGFIIYIIYYKKKEA